jgi:hypothetical protein
MDHFLVDRQRNSSVLDVRSFRAADCDTDHYLVVAKVRERLVVNKQRSHKFHMERFNLMSRFQIGLQLWKNWTQVEINIAWKIIRENIKISAKESLGYFELKKHKSRFDEGYSKLSDQRKHKLQWLQDPSKINGDNQNSVRREANRYFRNKKREYLKDKMNELVMNSNIKKIRDLYRGINEFKRGYQPRNNLVKDENANQ